MHNHKHIIYKTDEEGYFHHCPKCPFQQMGYVPFKTLSEEKKKYIFEQLDYGILREPIELKGDYV